MTQTKEELREYYRKYRQEHRDDIKRNQKKYYIKHQDRLKECGKEKSRKYRATHKKEVSEANKQWREKNKEYNKSRMKKWHKEHHEEDLIKSRNYHKTQASKNSKKKFRKNHRDKGREEVARRRAMKMSAGGNGITASQEKQIFEEYNFRCAYCGALTKLEVDHIVPMIKGGLHDIENATSACHPCNASKQHKSLLRYLYDRNLMCKAEVQEYDLNEMAMK